MSTWNADVVTYLDAGAYYLTPQQRDAVAMIINVKIVTYATPLSENYKWNPARSVYAYVTGVQDECVVWESVVNYDYQRVYDDYEYFRALNRNLCLYQRATEQNFIRLYNSLLVTKLPYDPVQVTGLEPALRRQLDSIRVKTLNPSQFNIELNWLTLTPETVCNPVVVDLPPIPPPRITPANLQPDSSSPSASPILNGGQPVGLLTPKPIDAFPGDFGERNQSIPNKPIQNYQRGRVSSGYLSNCSINVRSPAWPTPPGQQPPFFTGITAATPDIPPVIFTQTPGSDCGNGVRGFFTQNGTVIEAGAQGLISWSWPVFARYTDGSWAAVAP